MVITTLLSFNSLNMVLILAIQTGIKNCFWFIILSQVRVKERRQFQEFLIGLFYYNGFYFMSQRTYVKILLLSISIPIIKSNPGKKGLGFFSRPTGPIMRWVGFRPSFCHLGFFGKEHSAILVSLILMSTHFLHPTVYESSMFSFPNG